MRRARLVKGWCHDEVATPPPSASSPDVEEPHRTGRKFLGSGLQHQEDKSGCGDKVGRSHWGGSFSFPVIDPPSNAPHPNSNRKDEVLAFDPGREVTTPMH